MQMKRICIYIHDVVQYHTCTVRRKYRIPAHSGHFVIKTLQEKAKSLMTIAHHRYTMKGVLVV